MLTQTETRQSRDRGVSVVPPRRLVARLLRQKSVVVFAIKDEEHSCAVKVATVFVVN